MSGTKFFRRDSEYKKNYFRKAKLARERHNGLSNREFSKQEAFVNACEKAGVKPTVRQASKFRRKYGAAFSVN